MWEEEEAEGGTLHSRTSMAPVKERVVNILETENDEALFVSTRAGRSNAAEETEVPIITRSQIHMPFT